MTEIENNGITLKRKPKTSLKDLIFLYEKNYIKIKKFYPNIRKINEVSFLLPKGDINYHVNLRIFYDSDFTTVLKINHSELLLNQKVAPMELEVAIYHDLKVAEVIRFNGKKLFWNNNKYPNKNMFQKDEKFQWNKLLSELLRFSKREGLANIHINPNALT